MNNFSKAIITLLLLSYAQMARCESDLIWDFKDDHFLEIIEGKKKMEYSEEKKVYLEGEISRVLKSGVTYSDLTQCLFTALKKSYDIEIFSHINQQKIWDHRNKMSELLPNFAFNYDLSFLMGEYLVGGIVPIQADETAISRRWELNWDIANKGKTLFESAAKNKYVKSSKYALDYTIDEVVLNTALNYYDLLGRKLEIDVYRINLKDREEQLKMAKAKHELGVSSKFDVVRAEAEVARAQQEYLTLFNQLRFSQAKLANVMGIEVLTTVYPVEQAIKPRNLIDENYGVEELYKIAMENRDDIKSKEKDIQALELEKKSTYADFVPRVEIATSHADVGTLSTGLRTSDTYMIRISAPLGKNLGVNTYTKAKMQEEEIKVEKLKLTKLKRQVKQDIIEAYYDSMTQREKIDAAKSEVIAADESLKIALVQMEIGQATFLDVLQAQSAKTTARSTLIAHIVNYNKSQLNLLFDIGVITTKAALINYETGQNP